MENYLKKAVEKATVEFWASIAKSFPDVESGDMSPMEVNEFYFTMEKFVKAWLKNNV